MSGDQLASSFGDPNAQPPTPKQTPTSSIFPSPVFETPKNNQGRFEDSRGGWTPRFAEEFSVFNTTPGNLRGTQGPFPDFGPPTPFTLGSGQKRPLSAQGLAAEIASHVNFSPNPNLPLPSIDPSKVLRSSPTPLSTPTFEQPATPADQPSGSDRSIKKARRGTVTQESTGQTATPPPSARKGERKLAPKLDTAMQNDQGFGQPDFMAQAQQPVMGSFVTNPGDMFGYPLSAPATSSGFAPQRSFWDSDPSMGGMDIDFSANGGAMFQTTPNPSHQQLGSVDWARNTQLLQGQMSGDTIMSTAEHQPALVSPVAPVLATSAAEQALFAVSYPTPVDNPFGISGNDGGVDPGLLFSRPQSASMDAASFNSSMQAPLPEQAPNNDQAENRRPSTSQNAGELRRSSSTKLMARKQKTAPASSPIKPSARPGLSRSFSENRGKVIAKRPTLPTLAPAPRPQSQMENATVPVANHPIAPRPSGRSSPLKNQHNKLPSLSSIPETAGPRMRTEAKLIIDANGRASVEATVVMDYDAPPTIRKRHSTQSVSRRQQWHSSEDDDSSSTDDEPIIIPSRNTSFALPDPRKPTTIHPFHNSHRSVSERSTTSYTSFRRGSQDDNDSDGETVVNANDLTPTAKQSGDAASELRKLRETRRSQVSPTKPRRLISTGALPASFHGSYSAQTVASPTALTDASLPTPSSRSRHRGLRCTCTRSEAGRDEYLVQCESCENWLHGRCVNVTKQTMPPIYICAFCADTPNARGAGRVRDHGRISGLMGPPASANSPLAHKSFKSFR